MEVEMSDEVTVTMANGSTITYKPQGEIMDKYNFMMPWDKENFSMEKFWNDFIDFEHAKSRRPSEHPMFSVRG